MRRTNIMSAIPAIDAAWTPTQPSGVALVAAGTDGWRCVTVAPSYTEFIAQSEGRATDWSQNTFRGTPPDIPRLLEAAQLLAGGLIDLVTLDMPVATVTFSSRRSADNAISKEFGARWCSAHTLSDTRPGRLGALVSAAFHKAGYPMATTLKRRGVKPCLVEVYPHPALLSLLKRSSRVPYKVSKSGTYWPEKDLGQRIAALLKEFTVIHASLSRIFGPLTFDLPRVENVHTLAHLKRYEDALDALVCAWVGVEYLSGKTIAFGDATAAIRCPSDVVLSTSRRA